MNLSLGLMGSLVVCENNNRIDLFFVERNYYV